RRGVGARVRIGERETGNFEAFREPRQVVALLLVGAVMHEQLPGPSELGTITVTTSALQCEASLTTTCECANAEKPSPPYSFGMIIPRKPLSLMYCQTGCGRSR